MEILFGVVAALAWVGFVYYIWYTLVAELLELNGYWVHALSIPSLVFIWSGLSGNDANWETPLWFAVWWYLSATLTILINACILFFQVKAKSRSNTGSENPTRSGSSEEESDEETFSNEADADLTFDNFILQVDVRSNSKSLSELGQRWQVEAKPLGMGSFGEVYRATRPYGPGGKSVQVAAIKILRPKNLSPELLTRFRREMEIVANLDHEHCVKLLDWPKRDDPQELWFATNFVSDQNLWDLLFGSSRVALNARLKANFAMHLATALAHAERRNIVHGDVKPDNLLVTRDGSSLVLADFGLAFVRGKEDWAGIRNNYYAAPEVTASRAVSPNSKSDVYSKGLTLLELLGERPAWFDLGEVSNTELTKVKKLRGPHWDRVVPAHVEFLKPLLHPNPDARPRSVQVYEHLLKFGVSPWPKGSLQARASEDFTRIQRSGFQAG